MLPSSDMYDSIMCTQVADVDFDGHNELLLGTYGQELLVYKEEDVGMGVKEFSLSWQRSFSQPIMGLHWLNMTEDGTDNLIVVTLHGVHILQPDINNARVKVLKSLDTIKDIRELEDKIEQELKRQEQLKAAELRLRTPQTPPAPLLSSSSSFTASSPAAALSSTPPDPSRVLRKVKSLGSHNELKSSQT